MSNFDINLTDNEIQAGTGAIAITPGGTEVVTINNGVILPDGTKTEPAIRFSDDPNTGIYSPTNEDVALVGNGEEIIRAVGVTSGVNYLQVTNSVTADDVKIVTAGSDTDIDLSINPKGAGVIALQANVTTTGTIDGRDVAADGTKLDGIEAGATADQSAAEIKTAYESNADTNAFTDAEQTKLAGITAGANIVNPMTTSQDIIVGGASGAAGRLGVGTEGQVLTVSGGNVAWAAAAGGGLSNVVEDTTPQLGGNLDVQANSITTSTVNGGITITPNGTGNVTLGTMVFDSDQTITASEDNYVLTYDNATGLISLEAAAGGGGGATGYAYGGTVTTAPSATGEDSVVIGDGATDNGKVDSIVIGAGATVTSGSFQENIVIGKGGSAGSTCYQSVLIGGSASGSEYAQVAVGFGAIASGRESVALGGKYSTGTKTTASGTSAVAVGKSVTATGTQSTAVGALCTATQNNANSFGNDSDATGTGATALGYQCSASGNYSVAAGRGGNASGVGSVAFTGRSTKSGAFTISHAHTTAFQWANTFNMGQTGQDAAYQNTIPGGFNTAIIYANTTDATQTEMSTGDTPGTNTRLAIPSNGALQFRAMIMGIDTTTNTNAAAYTIDGLIINEGGTSTLVYSNVTVDYEAVAGWDATVEADDTNDALVFKVTGAASTNITWNGRVDGNYLYNL